MSNVEVSVVLRRVLNAPLARVWAAWASGSDELAHWYRPGLDYTITEAVSDFRVGGLYRIAFQRKGDQPLVERGRYLEIEPMARILYEEEVTENGKPHHAMRDEIRFEALSPTQTLVTVTCTGPEVWLAGGGIYGSIESLAAHLES